MSTTITIPVEAVRARLANGKLWTKGWGVFADPNAPTCLHGAIRYCQPVPGDAFLIEQVGARFGFGISDNDNADDWSAVDRMLVEHAEITDIMLADTFGPQWEPIVALVRRAAVLTGDEVKALDAARDAAWDAATRDLIGQYGYTQAHYDLLTRPWASVIGPVHPDDKEKS